MKTGIHHFIHVAVNIELKPIEVETDDANRLVLSPYRGSNHKCYLEKYAIFIVEEPI